MKLLNVYKFMHKENPWILVIPIHRYKLRTLNIITKQFDVYTFRKTNSMEYCCGDKLTRKDNEIISNLQK
ncbi:hypothetical protein AVV30_gp022 [Vibrio phage phi 1]|uniref:Uncharacterized protein n=1 Tax=Vibrio phage phi 1 TaxID=1589297 RepID=A0A0B5HDW6_9CAUD|nr:hypothetical protein AVV30_gp022 [Vibrio phage phi 1]AJF40680.1 hypothetical protein SBVP1_0022 [Vibrio phage phi 1]